MWLFENLSELREFNKKFIQAVEAAAANLRKIFLQSTKQQ